ncbi:MAG: DUF1501 domain-containing protein [Planctomycetia bacterium]|nr:DUF1501 domain-containing protein [Planctomycetia bacterium]
MTQDGFLAQAAEGKPAAAGARLHRPARAKSVIVLFMQGGVSHVDTFDPKPELNRRHQQASPEKSDPGAQEKTGKLFGSPWKFAPHGQSGIEVSELFPHVARRVDDLAIIRGMRTDTAAHAAAGLQMNTGFMRNGFPSVGSWISYGLGRANDNLPSYIVLNASGLGQIGGSANWGAGFMPAEHQGVPFGGGPAPVANLRSLKGADAADQRGQLDLLARFNQLHLDQQADNTELAARIASYELAFRMQTSAPDAVDLSQESDETRVLYGLPKSGFGQSCLLARRLVERGVRFVQLYLGGWDSHQGLKDSYERNGAACDQPIAGLLTDLKRRGLFETTLVVWTSEFGRTPHAQGNGRDHHARGFTTWLAGGGVKGGIVHGATDELGYAAVEKPVHVHDLHATILHLLGIDHEKLTYRHASRDYRLTDVHGHVVQDILA